MWEDLVPISLFLSLAFTAVGLARVVADAYTRRLMIRAGLTPEHAQSILAPPRRSSDLDAALKWGLVTAGVGSALIALQFLPYGGNDPFSYGLVLLFGGAGLLAYHHRVAHRAA